MKLCATRISFCGSLRPRFSEVAAGHGHQPSGRHRVHGFSHPAQRRVGSRWPRKPCVFEPGERFQGWRLSLRDVTGVRTRIWLDQARRHLEERVRERTAELEHSRERYRALSGYLQGSIEKERTRISREIHDILGQDLTALNMGLHRLERSFHEEQDRRQAQVTELRALVAGTLETVRRISRELRPPMLDELGFAEAVAWQVRTFAQASGLKVEHRVDNVPELSPDLATALYRVCRSPDQRGPALQEAPACRCAYRAGPAGLSYA